MQKWEYCVIGPIKAEIAGVQGHYSRLVYFDAEGQSERTIKDMGRNEHATLGSLIAQLGERGWEMVGCGACGSTAEYRDRLHLLYFKRPKE